MIKKIARAAGGHTFKTLTAAVLAVGMLLSLTVGAAGSESKVDLSKPCSLTVAPGSYEDMDEAKVVIDLYKVADAVADDTYDTYGYETAGAYASLQEKLDDLQALTAADWRDLAAEAANITLKGDNLIAKEADGVAVGETIGGSEGLAAGLYLLVARGSDIDAYIDENEDGDIITLAHSNNYVYSYLPELISLPSTANLAGDPEQTVMTSDGDWLYDLSAMLKPAQDIRFGSIEIQKTLSLYVEGTDGTFIFDISAVDKNNNIVYTNVAAVSMTSGGTGSVIVDGIPVGSTVTVTEMPSAHYVAESGVTAAPIVVEANTINSVSFTNAPSDRTPHQDGSIINNFNKEEDGWHHTPVYSNGNEK